MLQQTVQYEADGLSMRGQFIVDDAESKSRPGVLVFPEGFGLGEPALKRARMLAELGYAVLACDLHGDARLVTEMDQIMPLLAPLLDDPERARVRAKGALTALRLRPEVDTSKIAAIGYCIGGSLALELARSGAELVGVVGFHSGLSTTAPHDAGRIKGKILICIGADDPSVDAAQRQAFEVEMRAAKVNWQMNIYGGVVHGFTNVDVGDFGRPDMLRYDAQADARSWTEMRAFLEDIFR